MTPKEFEQCKNELWKVYDEVWVEDWGEKLIAYTQNLQDELIELKKHYSIKNMLLGMTSTTEQKVLKKIFKRMEEEGIPFPNSL